MAKSAYLLALKTFGNRGQAAGQRGGYFSGNPWIYWLRKLSAPVAELGGYFSGEPWIYWPRKLLTTVAEDGLYFAVW